MFLVSDTKGWSLNTREGAFFMRLLHYILIVPTSLIVGVCIGVIIHFLFMYEPPKLTISESKPSVEYRIFGQGFDIKKRADKDHKFLLPVGKYLLFFNYEGKKRTYPFVIKKNEDLILHFGTR